MTEIIGTIAACIELAKTLHAAILFIDVARDVSEHATEQRRTRLLLVAEIYKFRAWCDEIGVPNLVQGPEDRNCCPSMDEEVFAQKIRESDLRLDNESLIGLTTAILLDMKEHFGHVQRILDAHTSSPSHAESTAISEAKEKTKGGWMSKWKTRSVAKSNSNSSVNLERTSTGHKVQSVQNALKWVSSDKKNLASLMADIRDTNTALMDLLGPLPQQWIRREAQGATLNDEISNDSPGLSDLDGDTDLGSLAQLKSFHDQVGDVSNKIETNNNTLKLQVLYPERLGPELAKAGANRSVYQVDVEAVLVEWKFYNKDKNIRLQKILQLNSLAILLNHGNVYRKFMVPECKRLVEDNENSRLGIVFSIPNITPASISIEPRPKIESLQHFIRTSTIAPPLGARFKMARELALAVYNLHSVYWLHKSIRSDNILFLERPEDSQLSPTTKLSKTNHSMVLEEYGGKGEGASSHTTAAIPSLHILGWEISRPDGPFEFSESLSYSTEGTQAARENMRLYSHPTVHFASKSTERARYRSQYDVYSLGLVLLEIGLWKTLDSPGKDAVTMQTSGTS
ncbi:hypothetical protein PG997_000474 [Apiospora hydei]|uniref:Protein kinase domain-containing protein n=1 Tax=Apiospora hydei TaxID=1337664 RepID=A0ABR1XAW0_9PEZI